VTVTTFLGASTDRDPDLLCPFSLGGVEIGTSRPGSTSIGALIADFGMGARGDLGSLQEISDRVSYRRTRAVPEQYRELHR
jgi:hypothetical protein